MRDDGSGFARFREITDQGVGDRWAMAVRTPSGGMHYYYPSDPSVPRMSWVCASAHVDFRGAGGYIIIPPSQIKISGKPVRYQVLRTIPNATPVDTARLRCLLDPEAAKRRMTARLMPQQTDNGEVKDSVLAGWVSSRPQGERNTALFWAACRLVEAGRPIDRTFSALAPAAQQAGLLDREIVTTVRSAYRHTFPNQTATCNLDSTRPALASSQVLVL